MDTQPTVGRIVNLVRRGSANPAPLLAAIAVSIFSIHAWLLVRTPYLYETRATGDTLYMLNIGWAIRRGLRPNVDFAERYGGIVGRAVALCLRWTSPSVKAMDHAMLLLYAISVALLLVVARRRLSPVFLFAAFLVISALLLTRSPLELPFQLTETAAHATLYNRLGWVLLFVVAIAVCVPVNEGRELPGLAAAGIAFVVMVADKAPFALALVPLVGAFLLVGRTGRLVVWLGWVAVGVLICWAALGIGPSEWIGIGTATAALLPDTDPEQLAKKLVHVLVEALLPVSAIAFVTVSMVQRDRATLRLAAVTILLLAMTGFALVTGMPAMKDAATPAPAIAAVILAEMLARRGLLSPACRFPLAYVVLVLAVPHLVNAGYAASRERHRDTVYVTTQGPLSGYAVAEPAQSWMPPTSDARAGRHLAGLRSFRALGEPDKLVLIVEGGALIRTLPGYRTLGILSIGPRIFPFVVGARPVGSVDMWPERTAFEGLFRAPLPADVDILMLLRDSDDNGGLSTDLAQRAASTMVPCLHSQAWDLLIRKSRAGMCNPAVKRSIPTAR